MEAVAIIVFIIVVIGSGIILYMGENMNNNTRYEAMARLPVYTPLYYNQWDIKSRAMRLDQDFNCHSFIIKKNLVTKKYIGGFNSYKHGGGSVKYFKFKDKTHSWILPVYEGSYTAQHPEESFPWNKDIIFVGEVSEEEYNKQFKEQQAEQLELF